MDNSLSLYIHIPFCISKCDYCDFFSIKCQDKKIPDDYIKALCSELLYRKKQYNIHILKTIYIGGGTPSLLSEKQIRFIFDFIRKNFILSDDIEITFEANPDDINLSLLEVLSGCGVNRLSLGIQSLCDDVLKFIHRRADKKKNLDAIRLIREKWNGQISVDLICGLPYETEKSFLQAVNDIIEYKPHHISMYSLTVEEGTVLFDKIQSGKIKYDYDFSDSLWLKAKDVLLKSGYVQYEISNFCRDDFYSRHNMTYWSLESYIGAGSGASSTVYGNMDTVRFTNTDDINGYISFWMSSPEEKNIPQQTEFLDEKTLEFEFFMMGFRTRRGISREKFLSFFKRPLPSRFLEVFEQWKKKNLAQEKNGYFALNSDGMLFLNRFLEEIH
ncbi:MAG: radical SAM family heme chaperone HemW [Treponema sp.]|nr:radical SAM family heme chaperone HemW [Treponema sp.]